MSTFDKLFNLYDMRLLTLTAIAACLFLQSCAPAHDSNEFNHNYMWFDCEANYATLSHPDSIRFYMKKCQDLGFDNVVVDMKSIMGEVLYDSKIAPYMGDWEGVERSRDYDMLGYFIEYGKELGRLFQITDDILDVTGEFEELGKSVGKDESADKFTCVKLYGLSGAMLRADDTLARSLAVLEGLDGDTQFLNDLTRYVRERKH